MTATFVPTETIVNLKQHSVVAAEHPRFAAAGPYRVLGSRDVPGVYTGPLVHRVLIESVPHPGEQQWVGIDELDAA